MIKLSEKSLTVNSFEFGWLYASIGDAHMKRMKKECPRMYLRMQILFAEAYLEHPTLYKQAGRNIKRYQKELQREFQKEEEHYAKQVSSQRSK